MSKKNRIIEMPGVEHDVEKCGALQFSALECEALRSIAAAEGELRAIAQRLARRKQAVFADLAKAHNLPGDAIVSNIDLEKGTGAWTVPQKNPVPEAPAQTDVPTNGTEETK